MRWHWIILATIIVGMVTSKSQGNHRPKYRKVVRNPPVVVTPAIKIGQTPGPVILPQIRPQLPPTIIIPRQPYPPTIVPRLYPQPYPRRYPITPLYREKDLERLVERNLKLKFGRIVDDVDVDVDFRRRRVEVEVELRDFRYAATIRRYVYVMPQLRGYRVKLKLDD